MQLSPPPILNDRDAWKSLPSAASGSGQPLPVWARALAEPLPSTTAAMLELDYLHRAASPLEPVLRAKLRHEAAVVSGCHYSQQTALYDMHAAGMPRIEIDAWRHDELYLAFDERVLMSFARKLSRGESVIDDAEIAELVSHYGIRSVVTIVLLLVFAAFHDRLLLALGITSDDQGPFPPVDVRFRRGAGYDAGADRGHESCAATATLSGSGARARYAAGPRATERRGRVEAAPEGAPPREKNGQAARRLRMAWSLACLGYEPQMARAWSQCARAFHAEAQNQQAFAETLEWLHARSRECLVVTSYAD